MDEVQWCYLKWVDQSLILQWHETKSVRFQINPHFKFKTSKSLHYEKLRYTAIKHDQLKNKQNYYF